MMYYKIDEGELLELVEEEVSKVADDAYADDGTSLYDFVVITEKDRPGVLRFIEDAVNAVLARCGDICKKEEYSENGGSGERLVFYVPDFDMSHEDAVDFALTRAIVASAVSMYFESRRPASVQEYQKLSEAAMTEAVTLLKTRKPVFEEWT